MINVAVSPPVGGFSLFGLSHGALGLVVVGLFVLVFLLTLLFLCWLDRGPRPPVKGYKGFIKEAGRMYCLNMTYEVGGSYRLPVGEIPVICDRGFHFCGSLTDVMNYYSPGSDKVYCEVEAFGKVVTWGNKSCTNGIRIVRQLSVPEIREILNRERPGNYFLMFFPQVPTKWTDGKPQVETVRQFRRRTMGKRNRRYRY